MADSTRIERSKKIVKIWDVLSVLVIVMIVELTISYINMQKIRILSYAARKGHSELSILE